MKNQILSKFSIIFILTFGKGMAQSCSHPLFAENGDSEVLFFTELKHMPNPSHFLSFPYINEKLFNIMGDFWPV